MRVTPNGAEVRPLVPGGGPPSDREAEALLLGSILLGAGALARVRDLVDAEDFHLEPNGDIYRAALAVADRGEAVGTMTVAWELERMGALQRVGGRAHLELLREETPTAADAEVHAGKVRSLATLRRVGAEALDVARAAHNRTTGLDELGERIDVLRDTAAREAVWQPPLPLVDTGALPDFPLEALPGWCAAFAAALAEDTQTPRDLAGMIVLASLATCAGGRVRVRVKPGWEEPLNLYALVALPPGERKSAVFEAATAPLSQFEEERAQAFAPIVTEAGIRRRALERAAEKAETEAANAKTPEAREVAILRATELALEAESVIVPAPYRLLADDATPEILATLLAQQGGRIALLSPEGGVVGQMAGRYSSARVPGANLGVYLKGHAGDRLRVDRVGRASEYVTRPALTIGLAVQPEVLRTMADVPELGGLGVLARFLYALPHSLMGDRSTDPEPVPAKLADEYASKLILLARNLDTSGGAWTIPFASTSRRLLTDYSAALEPRLGEKGDLRHMRDWAGKLPGAIARVASLIHLAGSVRGAWGEEVPPAAVESAITVGDYAIEHAKAVFSLMGADPQVELARRVLRWIADGKLTEFSRRDAFYHLRGNQLPRVTDLDPALALLVAHGYLAPVAASRGPGRPSQKFRVNPLAQNPHSPQNRGEAGVSVGSGGFVLRRPGVEAATDGPGAADAGDGAAR
jgi:replicative DNA helicase